MSRSSGLSLPGALDGHALADWTEATMLIEQRYAFSRSSIRGRLRDVLSHDEVEIDLLFAEIRRRSSAAPDIYPFTIDDNRMVRTDADPAIYSYLLVLSLEEAPFRKRRRFATVDVGMDLLTIAALTAYLGSGSVGLRFAWPPLQEPDRRPTNFGMAIDWLADRLDRNPGTGFRSPRKKDGGVDVVVWRPFRDGAGAFLVLLAQTTMQRNFVPKAKDIRAHQWNEWIPLGVPPLTAIVVPYSIPVTSDSWDDMHYDVNVILDRMRLCELLELVTPIDANLRNALEEWGNLEIAGMAL